MSSSQYYPYYGQATVHPAEEFDPTEDANKLRAAMKGFGCDESIITDILVRRDQVQRLEIAAVFKTAYGKDLVEVLKSELGGNYESVIVALMTPLPLFYARELHHAIKGLGTDEDALIEVLCTLSNFGVRLVGEHYKQRYGESLEEALAGDTSGHFRRLLISQCQGKREELTDINMEETVADAQALFEAGEGQWGTDESEFNRVFAVRSYQQLRAICTEYGRISGRALCDAIRAEFSGDVAKGLCSILECVESRTVYFAKRLHTAMDGIGTNDRTLIRIVVGRSEIDLADIKEAYEELYGKSLQNAIKGDTSGDYKKVLLAIVN